MRVAVVINAAAGGALGRERVEDTVEAALRGAGLDPVEIPPGDLGERLDAALASGAGAVVVGGGDGTIAAAAARLAGTGVPLGILPLGTMNLLARDLGLPLELEAAAAALAHGEVRRIDVAEVNGVLFCCASMIGLPTHIGRHRERARGKLGLGARWGVLVAALRGVVRHPPMRLLIEADGRTRRIWTRALAISCNPLAEDADRFPARTELATGRLGLYVAHRFGAWWVVRFAFGVLFRNWREHADLSSTTPAEVRLVSGRQRLRVMNDGEAVLLDTPLRYTIRPGALAVLVPPAPDAPSPVALAAPVQAA